MLDLFAGAGGLSLGLAMAGMDVVYATDRSPHACATLNAAHGRELAAVEDLSRPERVYRHSWSVGDTVIWDNRGVLHRAVPYAAGSPREMLRTTVLGDEPIWHKGKVVGWVTSGGYAHYVDRSLAQGYVPKDLAMANGSFEIEIIGDRRKASIIHEPLFDPEAKRMRM